ncbi:hypothetical protein EFQ23_04775 [Limosilactobacillus fermentum]|uniref:hypothetical protein n=1 Tax=Limosilactobacillus fermentum TaxID=1613 RepID=UPI00070F09E9|nr:hypothetical protein [Limosilactobacillus fermentum]KRN13818.1 hypothetical protein IV46_GL000671 [Limosilactobacillus fermentum]MCH5388930.1 hypothetical protein [Limosilactobacillus fermentum]MCH5393467.1 hypothetical protein [Limosilactobacillus fermentum]MCT3435448.1 hypothetical protein [Limosilactobacillus fermentum]PPX65675.1 hypothetical protein C5O28_06035 [Limosilactobacillus fermentum]
MDNETVQNLVNDYAIELGTLHSNLVIERANNRALREQLDKANQELKELKDKQDTDKQDATKED